MDERGVTFKDSSDFDRNVWATSVVRGSQTKVRVDGGDF